MFEDNGSEILKILASYPNIKEHSDRYGETWGSVSSLESDMRINTFITGSLHRTTRIILQLEIQDSHFVMQFVFYSVCKNPSLSHSE